MFNALRLVVPFAIAMLIISGTTRARGDTVKGKNHYEKRCADCHSLVAGEHKGGGPSLAGMFARPAGTAKGFFYSKYLRAAGEKGLTWTDNDVRAYIESPNRFLKKYLGVRRVKSKMKRKYRDPQLRHDVVEYLKQATR